MNIQSGVTIKGFYIKAAVKYAQQKLGPEGLAKLREKFGKDIHFFPFRDYPMEDDVAIKTAIVEIMNGENTPAGQFEIGKLAFNIYMNTLIGKTMFSLLGGDPMKVALATAKVVDTVTKGLKTEVEKLAPNKVRIIMKDSSYDIKHYEGIFYAALEYLQYLPQTSSNVKSDGTHEYIIAWSIK